MTAAARSDKVMRLRGHSDECRKAFSDLFPDVQPGSPPASPSGVRAVELRCSKNKPSTDTQGTGRATRFRLRDWYLENSRIAPRQSLDWPRDLDRIRGYFRRPNDLEWPRQSGGARGRWPDRPPPGSVPASIQSPIPPVEPPCCQQQQRYAERTHGRRVQKWTRRVLRPGTIQRPDHSCSKCMVGHH